MNERVNVLGVGISVLTLASAREVIAQAVEGGRKGYVCVTGVHGVTEAQASPELRRILNQAFLCTPDGMPMVWLGKLQGYGANIGRVYGPDLMLELMAWSCGRPCKHFLLGGAPGVAEDLRDRLRQRFSSVRICGCHSPPFRALDPGEEQELRALFDRLQPDVTWVGMSTPKQEMFMANYLPRLNTKIMIGVGAAFDFHAGRIRQAPRWVQRSGLEWLFRLSQEPRRLAGRYLRNNPLFLWRILLQLTGMRKYVLE